MKTVELNDSQAYCDVSTFFSYGLLSIIRNTCIVCSSAEQIENLISYLTMKRIFYNVITAAKMFRRMDAMCIMIYFLDIEITIKKNRENSVNISFYLTCDLRYIMAEVRKMLTCNHLQAMAKIKYGYDKCKIFSHTRMIKLIFCWHVFQSHSDSSDHVNEFSTLAMLCRSEFEDVSSNQPFKWFGWFKIVVFNKKGSSFAAILLKISKQNYLDCAWWFGRFTFSTLCK